MASLANWVPKTELGKEVMEGKVTSLDEVFAAGRKIKEPEIIDKLLPNLKTEIIFVGGSSGKGGGKRRTPTKRTTRMHRSGRRYTISAVAIIGNGNGYFGIGKSESKEHRAAIEKATQNAKLAIMPVRRSCGSWECACNEKHSIPVEVSGKSGSVSVLLKPAPKGIGLCISDESKKIMHIAGIRDIWSKSHGNTGSRVNAAFALYNAFKAINRMKLAEIEENKPAAVAEAAV
ncbi:MAG: 30S ribosomal protein S5 [Candidatus Aenigmarchaeota archaeon]|nr:30S ribosomal protein S5 [Candidatus Aenigmarchaeota archaeon]